MYDKYPMHIQQTLLSSSQDLKTTEKKNQPIKKNRVLSIDSLNGRPQEAPELTANLSANHFHRRNNSAPDLGERMSI